jgi:hypothetical protein
LDDVDVLQLQNEQLQNENEQLVEEKAALETKEKNLRCKNARLSATFVSAETLKNPNISVRREDKNATMRERFDHIFTHDATFKMFTIVSMSRDLLATSVPANPVVCIREDKRQYRNLMFPVFMNFGKETKDNLATFADVFDFSRS